MPIYLGNTEVVEYINNSEVDIANPIQYFGPPQFFNVRKCGTSDPTTKLAIYYSNLELLVGYAVRPILIPGSTVPLPGYEYGCYELVSVATDGIQCSTRAPAVDCSQAVCIATTTTTTTTAGPIPVITTAYAESAPNGCILWNPPYSERVTYYICPTCSLSIGTIIYNSYPDSPINPSTTNGGVSDGTNYYTLDLSGSITAINNCPTTTTTTAAP
jgi:hypothetical protein